MNFVKILALGAIAANFALAQGENKVSSLYDVCRSSLESAKSAIPANGTEARFAAVEAEGIAFDLKKAVESNAMSERSANLAVKCSLYVQIIKIRAESQKLRNNIAENWEKRATAMREIENVLDQINRARSGQVLNLEVEKKNMKDQEALLQAEIQQKQEKLAADSAANEAALRAAEEREADLQKALAEERAKAEQRQKDAMNKLNELQSKLIQVSKDARGIILSMSDILFGVNQASLTADLKTSLAKVAGILSVYQQFSVSVEGNTDNTGSAEFNMKLSQQRATNVMKFLISQGISPSRLKAKGLGMTMPIADNNTKEGRQKNRRVDLVIQDKALLKKE